MILQRHDGSRWSIGAPTITSDGFVLATGTLIDDDDNAVLDDDGFPVMHSFFLGAAK